MDSENKIQENIPYTEELERVKPVTRFQRRILRVKRKLLAKHVWFVRTAILALIITALLLLALSMRFVFANTRLGLYASLVNNFLFTPQKNIEEYKGHTNILLLGRAGEGHTAPDLTDTLMLVSVSRGDIDLISIPRDIWIPDLKAKINSAYYWGNKKQTNGGMILARAAVEDVVGIPIHYTFVVDFSAFVKIINILEGVEVDVKEAFVDEKFPIPGKENDECEGDPEYKCRYETIEFKKGLQTMDGETALKFVRSRQSEDLAEGTDLARAARQQQVFAAIKNKITSREVLLSPGKLAELWKTGWANVLTDMPQSALAIVARRVLESKDRVTSSNVPEEFLFNPPYSADYDNLYVFIPKSEDWAEVHKWIEKLLGI